MVKTKKNEDKKPHSLVTKRLSKRNTVPGGKKWTFRKIIKPKNLSEGMHALNVVSVDTSREIVL